LWSQCHRAERSLFLQPFTAVLTPRIARLTGAALHRLAGDRAAMLAALVPEVGSVLGPVRDDRGIADIERGRVYEAVTAFIDGLTSAEPVPLMFDDLHNADQASVELVHYLARRATGTRLLIVVTARTEEGEQTLPALADVATRLDLGPLPPEAVAQLTAAAGHENPAVRAGAGRAPARGRRQAI
jgi:predicted ATPase